jgi:hypothetical protein
MIAPRVSLTAVLMSALLVVIGCGGGGPPPRPEGVKVGGKVLLPNGSPLTGGTLILRPEAGLYGATAQIQPDGSFKLRDTSNTETVVQGKYQVFVAFPNPAHDNFRETVNRRYQESEDGDSDLIVEIQGPNDDLVIQFNR